jgi:large subunit ribosomal protein L18
LAAKSDRLKKRFRRKQSIRKRLVGSTERPRLSIFRSTSHMYAQIVDDTTGNTIVSASTLSKELKGKIKSTGNIDAAKKVGELLSKVAKKNNISTVAFDRNGFLYHGRVKALADAARDGGLEF